VSEDEAYRKMLEALGTDGVAKLNMFQESASMLRREITDRIDEQVITYINMLDLPGMQESAILGLVLEFMSGLIKDLDGLRHNLIQVLAVDMQTKLEQLRQELQD
jgi:hypothetical protein